jgi:hypothetical protein
MKSSLLPRLLWAGRELLLQPGAALLLTLALVLLTAMVAGGLLLTQALTATTARLLDQGPDLVVRRAGPVGWLPIPAREVATALAVPGVVAARPRIWGTALASNRAVTVMATDDQALQRLMMPHGLRPPAPGDAVAGGGIIPSKAGTLQVRRGAIALTLHVTQHFPLDSDLATHDLLLIHPREARTLFGLAPGEASDLALFVFHPAEAEALRTDLGRAFAWPVHITTRQDTRKYYAAALGRRGGLATMLFLPAALALMLLTASIARQQIGDRSRVGLLKALGWTSRDILGLQVTKALLVGLPAVAAGLVAAYVLVYGPLNSRVGHLLLGWQELGPLLPLDAGYAAPVFLEVAGMLLVPFIAAVLWSSLRMAASEPQDLLNRGNGP